MKVIVHETMLQKIESFLLGVERAGAEAQLLEHPTWYIFNIAGMFDSGVEEFLEKQPDAGAKEVESALESIVNPDAERVWVYFKGDASSAVRPRDLKVSDNNQLVVIRGIISTVSGIEPLCTRTVYKCDCGEEEIARHNTKKVLVKKCPNPDCGGRMKIESETIINSRMLYIQDDPAMLDNSKAAVEIRGIIKGELATRDFLVSGDLVTMTGIFRIDAKDEKNPMYEKYIDVHDITKEKTDVESIAITDDDKAEIVALSKLPKAQELLINSIAPSVYGYPDVKEGLLLWMVGGEKRLLSDGSKLRGNIHVMIVGDPSSAKSYIAKWLQGLMPKTIYTQGKGNSSVGLTATLDKDETTGKWMVRAGAAVRANNGYLIADEIDKMKKEDLDSLDEGLEQQTVTITKAINQTLNAEFSCLAIANPRLGRFDAFKTKAEQIQIASPAFFSRFDLKYALVDEPGTEKDTKIVKHMMSGRLTGTSYADTIPHTLLRKYVVYAKREIHPTFTPEAIVYLSDAFIRLRKGEKTVQITMRQLEGLTRLSEASAKLRLSGLVEMCDAERALRVFNESLKSIGCVGDIDAAEGRISKNQLNKADMIKKAIGELETQSIHGIAAESDIKTNMSMQGMNSDEVDRLMEKLKSNGVIYSPTYGGWKLC